ncbi:hypothetical protein [Vibrio nitrifigilis]|uniref:Uncharacterized protein n=1 Tax=Vibrio nitrifigilis TaxID=2789781 RepID=A0ABS0GB59_9VIBR|nr:hypothetical protein [Vibrio nitrifigilis]MBF8999601.1 hypothetical protein [Vibrio nitrifigilis]
MNYSNDNNPRQLALDLRCEILRLVPKNGELSQLKYEYQLDTDGVLMFFQRLSRSNKNIAVIFTV